MKKQKLQPIPQKNKRTLRDYQEQLYANKRDNLEEMDKLLGTYNLPRLNYEEIENMSGPITSNEIKYAVKKLPTNKSPGPGGFTGELHQTFRKELTHILLKLFKKLAEGQTLPNSFYQVTITLIQILQKNENCRLISLMNTDGKILNNTSKPTPTIL